jgi:hypothetical protein
MILVRALTSSRRLGVTLAFAALSLACFVPCADAGQFGLLLGTEGFSFATTNLDGTADLSAGSHPFAVTTSFVLSTNTNVHGTSEVSGDLKDVHVELPPGVIGDPLAVPTCSIHAFTTDGPPNAGFDLEEDSCPIDTQVGTAKVKILEAGSELELSAGVYNLPPPAGVPAELGFDLEGSPIVLAPSVRTDGDYGLSVDVRSAPQKLTVLGVSLTVWGVPADASHDGQREPCLNIGGACPVTTPPVAFFTLPTSCSGPQEVRLLVDSWEDPGSFTTDPGSLDEEGVPTLGDSRWKSASTLTHDTGGEPLGLAGCEGLPFNPAISIAPDTAKADTPTGVTARLSVPQEGLLEPTGSATADIKSTTVTLPVGFAINPGQANGLVACQTSETGVGTDGPPSCPAASKVGTTEAETPLLHHKLTGDVYVLQSNPPNVKLLADLADVPDGVFVKLIGNVHLDETTGQVTTTFAETPQLPISSFTLSFSGGAQAALATPASCGAYQTNTDFTPWTTPDESDALRSSVFNVTQGPGGSSAECASTLPFAPSMIAGATTDHAGGYTNFTLLLQRGDGQQRLSSLQFKTPRGLLGMISKVPLCGEPLAAQGACPAASQIGHTVVEAGPGANPLVIPESGQPPAPIYLTAAYKGAPYGLSIAVPVVAGPFNLGTVVVRAKIEVDPHTAQLTITTDPLPLILDGVPTDVRTIDAVIDRPGFIFNPTGCSPQSFTGTAFSTEGAAATLTTPFQVGSCSGLKFKPNFKVSTPGKTSRRDGAGLDAKIVYPTGVLGANQASSQANIASVKVDLPKQLPSRLTTLQKACTAAVFEANPAKCPVASVVGHATAVTPVLPVALHGPAYFVSHGGEAFPSLIVVLQGYGVTVDLVGTTFITKAGITSSTFKQVPDVPITSFDLTLPEGRYSALASNLPAKAKGSFCGQNLAMPTAFKGQNSAEIHESTKITVSGCPKAKKKGKAKKK